MRPFFLMAGLFGALAVLAMLASSLADVGALAWFSGLRWLRVHVITLGILAEIAFGLLPRIVAANSDKPTPAVRWDIWFALNGGLVILLLGIPLVNNALILTGGTLIFAAALLLIRQLLELHPQLPHWSWRFYLAGVSFLLLGIFLGTGMWLGWKVPLQVANIKEVHIHANIWGFSSLVMAGLLIDAYPGLSGRTLAWPRSLTPIFWMMVVSAAALVAGPWLAFLPLTGIGLITLLAATLWLLLNVIVPLRGNVRAWSFGMWHLLLSYIWIFVPMLAGPLVLLQPELVASATIESSAPAGLVFTWVLQFWLAMLPFIFVRALFPHQQAKPGGNRVSVLAMNVGGIFYWAAILAGDLQAPLEAIAFVLWIVAILAVVRDTVRDVRPLLIQTENSSAQSEPIFPIVNHS